MARFIHTFFFATLFYLAAALPSPELKERASITALSSSAIHAFKPYAYYSSAAYCSPSSIKSWNCGANCNANSHFQPSATGGDGSGTRYWYVGYDPSLNTIIVSHEGKTPGAMLGSLNIANSQLVPLDNSSFFGSPSGARIHKNIAAEFNSTFLDIYNAVSALLIKHVDVRPSITTVGHSQGAALSLLDTIVLAEFFHEWTTVKFIGYGVPRIGNQAFADYVDTIITALDNGQGLTRINNLKDPVPINPSRALGFVHPSGEIHIQSSGVWDSCPGQDNGSGYCIRGAVQNNNAGNKPDDYGPYDGVTMGC
ncbi:lipase [Schizopora paradoxa]|uniref:Lipase n=1 Tax=Schizopora paradoxa TaxID=27342 RepID=A0A0H2RXM2_9AGAM|nr:lipase [Schizopora paradoxa]